MSPNACKSVLCAAALVVAACGGCEHASTSAANSTAGEASTRETPEPTTPSVDKKPADSEAIVQQTSDTKPAEKAESKPAEKAPASAPLDRGAMRRPPLPVEPAPAVASRLPSVPRKVNPTGVADITFDTIKFPMEKTDTFDRKMLTPEIEALAGRKVKIRGYILPPFVQTGLTQFVLVRDNQECCFGPGAALFDCVRVDMVPGTSTDFTVRPVAVEGTFGFEEYLDPEGVVRAIYHLNAEAVTN